MAGGTGAKLCPSSIEFIPPPTQPVFIVPNVLSCLFLSQPQRNLFVSVCSSFSDVLSWHHIARNLHVWLKLGNFESNLGVKPSHDLPNLFDPVVNLGNPTEISSDPHRAPFFSGVPQAVPYEYSPDHENKQDFDSVQAGTCRILAKLSSWGLERLEQGQVFDKGRGCREENPPKPIQNTPRSVRFF